MITRVRNDVEFVAIAACAMICTGPYVYKNVSPHVGILMAGCIILLISLVIEECNYAFFCAGLLIILYSLVSAITSSPLSLPMFLLLFLASQIRALWVR